MNTIKIILVDDHPAFLNGLKMMIQEVNDVEIIGEAGTGIRFLELIKVRLPDIVLMDIRMPGMNGITAAKLALHYNPGIKVIFLSMFGEVNYLEDAIEAGASGFLLKPPSLQHLREAIESVMNGRTYFPSLLSQRA